MPRVATGTSIVYIQNADTIWVGSDSLKVELSTSAKSYECKIHHVGGVYFAFAGMNHLEGIFNTVEIAEQSIKASTTAEAARDEFVTEMIPLFEKANPVLRRFYSKQYDTMFEQVNPKFRFFEIIFFAFENNTTSVKYAGFQFQTHGKQTRVESYKDGCSRRDCSQNGILKILGKNQAFNSPNFNPQALANGDPVATIKQMIEMEMKSEPELVGGNVNIIRMDSGGAHWLTSAECR